MSTKDLVNAIIIGDALEIENAFQATMAEKISARLDDYRQEVAQNMFATEEVELDEATEGEMKNRERMAQRADAERLAHGAMSRDEYNKKWKKGPYAQPSQRKRLPEELELDEETLTVHPDKSYAIPGKGPAKHAITKDHGKAPDGSHVYSVKQPNGFHGVFAVKGSTVVGSSNNNLSKDEAHSLGAHYAKHGAVGIGVGKHWSLGSGIHGKVVKESIELEEAVSKLTHIRVDPTSKTAKDKLGKVGSFGQDVDLSNDDHYKKALADAHEYGKKQFGGEYTVTHMGPGHTAIRAGSVAKVRKSMQESVELDEEQLDELSKGTLGSYIKKAGQHRVRLAGAERDLDDKDTALQRAKHGADDATYDALSKAQDTMRKQRYKVSDKSQQRAQGISRAVSRLTKEEADQILASEEFAQLDELSKTTLGNYIKKASGGVKGAMSHAYVAGGGTGASEEGKKKSFDTAQKRLKGIRTAVDKLTKEDVEQLVVTTVESALYAMQDGRNVLDEQMDEAVSSSSKDNYEWTHGNKPKGHGSWYFSTVHPRQHDMQKHKDQTVNVTGTFGDAAKKAQAHFKEKGHKGEIHVLT